MSARLWASARQASLAVARSSRSALYFVDVAGEHLALALLLDAQDVHVPRRSA